MSPTVTAELFFDRCISKPNGSARSMSKVNVGVDPDPEWTGELRLAGTPAPQLEGCWAETAT